MQTATTITTTTRAVWVPRTHSTPTVQSRLTSPTRTQTRPMRSGRQLLRAATSQSSETERGEEEEEASRMLLIITTTWEEVVEEEEEEVAALWSVR